MILLVVGVDGADYDRVLAAENLPNIRFSRDRDHVRIVSSYPSSMPSWNSMLTGKPAKEHGMLDMTPEYTSDKIKEKRIWEVEKYRFGVIGVPGLWPPTYINGWMITGKLTPSGSIYTYPPELSSELDRLGYRVDVTVPCELNDAHIFEGLDKKAIERELDEIVVPKRTECLAHLNRTRPVDVCFVVYAALDWIQHLFMHDEEKVRWWYKRMDDEVGKLLEALQPEEKIIVSDHGFTLSLAGRNFTGNHRPGSILLSSRSIPEVLGDVGAVVDLNNPREWHHITCVFDLMQGILRQRDKTVERSLRALGYIN